MFVFYKGASMSPAFRPGDQLEVEPVPLADVRPGDVVVFDGAGRDGKKERIVHRVVSIGPSGPVTRGDANPDSDAAPLTPAALLGRVVARTRDGATRPVSGGRRGLLAARLGSLSRAGSRLPLLWRAALLVFRAAPGPAGLWLALLLASALLPVGQVFATRAVVDGLAGAAGKGLAPAAVRALLLAAGLYGLLLVAQQALSALSAWVFARVSENARDLLSRRIQEAVAALPFSAFEDPSFHDRLHRARSSGTDLPLVQVSSIGSILQSTLSLVAMGAVLFRYGFGLTLLLVAGTLPTLWVAARNSRRQWEWQRLRTPEMRRAGYYDWLLTARESAAELRLLGLAGHWRGAFDRARTTLRTERLSFVKGQALGQFGTGMLALGTTGAAMAVMARRALLGLATLGDLALFAQAFHQGQGLVRGLLQNAAQSYSNLLALSDLFEVLDGPTLPAQDAPEPMPVAPSSPEASIRFQGVVFAYPGSPRPALSGVDLDLPAGSVTALVGDNGAGKSTLVKLLCRLYDPAEGAVTWNGSDLRTIDPARLQERISVLMQTPMAYQTTARENVRLGRLSATDADLEAAAASAGFDSVLDRLPRGWETPLGKWLEDGADLSTGQWQRLALARALVRPSSLLVLDEPTSALDAWAENEFWERLEAVRGRRTVLVVTHKLQTARRADRICVLSAGAVVETGTHDELVASRGLYAAAWTSQGRRGASSSLRAAPVPPGEEMGSRVA